MGRSRAWRGDHSLTSAAAVTGIAPRRGSISSDDVAVEEEVVPVMMVDFRAGRRGRDHRGSSVCSSSSLRESVQDSPPPVGPTRSAASRGEEPSRSSSSGDPPPQAARVVATPVLPPPLEPPPHTLAPGPLLVMGDCPACPQLANFPMSASEQLRYRAPSIFTSPKPRRSKSFSLRVNKLALGEAVLPAAVPAPAVLQDPISV